MVCPSVEGSRDWLTAMWREAMDAWLRQTIKWRWRHSQSWFWVFPKHQDSGRSESERSKCAGTLKSVGILERCIHDSTLCPSRAFSKQNQGVCGKEGSNRTGPRAELPQIQGEKLGAWRKRKALSRPRLLRFDGPFSSTIVPTGTISIPAPVG